MAGQLPPAPLRGEEGTSWRGQKHLLEGDGLMLGVQLAGCRGGWAPLGTCFFPCFP